MSELLEKIRSRGYWKVIIRPATFVEKRVEHRSALLSILEKSSVESRGWSFPKVWGHLGVEEGSDWIGQEIGLEPIMELWRFYQSGQFIDYFAMPEDWADGPGLRLPAGDGTRRVVLDIDHVVLRFAQIFEFASRLSFTQAGDDGARIEIFVANMENHFLLPPEFDFGKVSWIPEAREPEMRYTADLAKIELVAAPRELALKPAIELLGYFGWNLGIDIVRDLQEQVLQNRHSSAYRR